MVGLSSLIHLWMCPFSFKWITMVCLGEKHAGSHSDLHWQFYRGTAIHGTWAVPLCLGYFPCTCLASITYGSCGSLDQQDSRWLPWASPQKNHFKPMISSKRCWSFQVDQPCAFAGNSAQSDTAYKNPSPLLKMLKGRLTGANCRLTDNLDFVKGKDCHIPTLPIIRTKYTYWKSE